MSSLIENQNKKGEHFRYQFYNDRNKKFDLSFIYRKSQNFDDVYNEIIASLILRVNKSFLRKNKDILITRRFMDSIREKAFVDLLLKGENISL